MKNLTTVNTLTKSEIKKVEKFAQTRDHKDSHLTGWYAEEVDDLGFIDVHCEICSNDLQDREADVVICVCTWDRRKSWILEYLSK